MAELNLVRTPTMRFAAIASLAVAGIRHPDTRPRRPDAVTFLVNLDSPADGGAADGTCDADAADGMKCTLAEAIIETNAHPGLDIIAFATTGFSTPGLIERATNPVVHLAGPGAYEYIDGLVFGYGWKHDPGAHAHRVGHRDLDYNNDSSSTLLRRNLLAEASGGPIEVYRDQQAAPVLDLARAEGTGTRVQGSVTTAAGRAVEIDIFSSATCGQAEKFLGTPNGTADTGGHARFDGVLDTPAAPGRVLNATASDTTRTSPLSGCRTVTAPPGVSIADTTLTEGDTGQATATFEITLTAPHDVETSIRASTFENTHQGAATPGTDYDAVDTRLVFAPGQSTATLEVPVNGDTLYEADETFKVVLSDPEGLALGDAIAQATVTDDDTAPTLTARDVTTLEPETGSSYARVAVRLSEPAGTPIRLGYQTTDGTTGRLDYYAKTGSTVIPAGERGRHLVFRIRPDALDEDPETFTVAITPTGPRAAAPAQATVTIEDSDPEPALTLGDLTLDEGRYAQLPIRLTAPSGRTVTATWTTTPGTAGTRDYFANQGTVTFEPGTTRRVIGVRTRTDQIDDPDETYTITLTTITHATPPTHGGTITIR